MKNCLLIIMLSLTLQGCIFVAGAAAGAAGIAVVYDHRKLSQIMADQTVVNTIGDKIKHDANLNQKTHINVACFNQIVLLTGEAPTPGLRQQAEALARETANVKRVYNEITVKAPSSSLTRASDAWITTKIKTELLATKDLKSGSIKVVTENGSVYLMGMVSRDQADVAADIARQVSGVQRVLKIFQYTR